MTLNKKKGLVIIHTGNGKGKTTAAFGMLMRALSYNMQCAVIQFIKRKPDNILKTINSKNLIWMNFGKGFTWHTQYLRDNIKCTQLGWNTAADYLRNPKLDFLLLDELNIVLDSKYLSIDKVLQSLLNKNPKLHVIITGRNAPAALIEFADLVTEMKEIKHPFKNGIIAQKGIEF